LKGLSTFLIVTAVFLVFHFTLHWTWGQTLAVPTILAIFFPAVAVYELVTKPRPTLKAAEPLRVLVYSRMSVRQLGVSPHRGDWRSTEHSFQISDQHAQRFIKVPVVRFLYVGFVDRFGQRP
jgi:hypothetical protein